MLGTKHGRPGRTNGLLIVHLTGHALIYQIGRYGLNKVTTLCLETDLPIEDLSSVGYLVDLTGEMLPCNAITLQRLWRVYNKQFATIERLIASCISIREGADCWKRD